MPFLQARPGRPCRPVRQIVQEKELRLLEVGFDSLLKAIAKRQRYSLLSA